MQPQDLSTMAELPLPAGVRSRTVPHVNGLCMHVLEAGFDQPQTRGCVLLLHGFPELAYSWRKIMLPLAAAGYHVIAPDQRGYGRTTGWQADVYADPSASSMMNLVRDAQALLAACGYTHVEAVVGHDFGSPVAAWCALIRPDIFRAVVMMSAPFGGPPAWPVGTDANPAALTPFERAVAELASLTPPRQHYQWHYASAQANDAMLHCAQGLPAFLRAYYHVKSADWTSNEPYSLDGISAATLAQLPAYYVMDADKDMAATVAPHLPTAAQRAGCSWLTEAELAVYCAEFARTGLQGGLDWYRCAIDRRQADALRLFGGKTIDVPAGFIGGRSDWGVFQTPGAFEKMRELACTQLRFCELIDGAGHWVQQEKPAEVSARLLQFLSEVSAQSG